MKEPTITLTLSIQEASLTAYALSELASANVHMQNIMFVKFAEVAGNAADALETAIEYIPDPELRRITEDYLQAIRDNLRSPETAATVTALNHPDECACPVCVAVREGHPAARRECN